MVREEGGQSNGENSWDIDCGVYHDNNKYLNKCLRDHYQ